MREAQPHLSYGVTSPAFSQGDLGDEICPGLVAPGRGFLSQAVPLREKRCLQTSQETHLSLTPVCQRKNDPQRGGDLPKSTRLRGSRKGCSQKGAGCDGRPFEARGPSGQGPRPLGPHSPPAILLASSLPGQSELDTSCEPLSFSFLEASCVASGQTGHTAGRAGGGGVGAGVPLPPPLKAREVCGHTWQPCSPSALHPSASCVPRKPTRLRPGLPLPLTEGQVSPEVPSAAGALGLQRERGGEGEGAWSTATPALCLPHPGDTCRGGAAHCKASGAYRRPHIGKHPGFGVQRLLPLWPQTHTELPPGGPCA